MAADRPKIPEVRFVGATWYDRGWRYWWLRFWLSVLWFVFAVIIVCVVGIFIGATVSVATSAATKVTIVSFCVIAIVLSCSSAYAQLQRTPEERATHRPISFPDPEYGTPSRGSVGIGVTAVGGGFMPFFLALSSLFIVGHIVGLFVGTLGRYATVEEWKAARAYGLEPELPDASDEFRRAHPLPSQSWFERRM